MSVKQLFFNFLLVTVNAYINFYRTPDQMQKAKDDEQSWMVGAAGSSDDFFDFRAYLDWQEELAADSDSSTAFIRELVKTQAFHTFIEQNHAAQKLQGVAAKADSDETAVFFESCVQLLN